MGKPKAVPAAAGTETVGPAPEALTLTRGLRFAGKRYGKTETIHPADLGMTQEHVDWLIQSGTAEIEGDEV